MLLRHASTTTKAAARQRPRQQAQQAPTANKRPVLLAAAAAPDPSSSPSSTDSDERPRPRPRVVAVAVDQSRASRRAVAWAVEHVWREERDAELRLLHVVPAVSSTSAFALGGLAAGVASAPLDSAASLDGGDDFDDELTAAVDMAAAEAIAAAAAAAAAVQAGGGGAVSVATLPERPSKQKQQQQQQQQQQHLQHHSSDEQRALARRAGRALSASLLPLARRRGCTRATVAVVRGRPGASVAEELCRAAEASGASMLVLASSRRPGLGDEGSGSNAATAWLGQVLGGALFNPPVSADVVRRCKVPTVLLGPE